MPGVLGAAGVHGRICPSPSSVRRGTRAYISGFSKRRIASARTLTTWWLDHRQFPADWIQETKAYQDQPRSAGSGRGALPRLLLVASPAAAETDVRLLPRGRWPHLPGPSFARRRLGTSGCLLHLRVENFQALDRA